MKVNGFQQILKYCYKVMSTAKINNIKREKHPELFYGHLDVLLNVLKTHKTEPFKWVCSLLKFFCKATDLLLIPKKKHGLICLEEITLKLNFKYPDCSRLVRYCLQVFSLVVISVCTGIRSFNTICICLKIDFLINKS